MKRLFLVSATLLMSITVMAKEIKTEIVIQATPEKIWSILTNFEDYPNWNPFVSSIEGTVDIGNKIKVRIHPPGGKEMTFRPVIITKIDEKELSWRGKLLVSGLFDGEHKFELIDNKNGSVTFIQSEKFKGLFVWMFNLKKTEDGFNQMNEKLKELAEKE
ncbi:hypothetical protein ABH942_002290 [Flavobacterium sp. 28YEA47A]|uniref:SRPBCC family protein n=1 Tax=Flavobacterium sp. 28YEA47A TaxID=3156276 RepID=UPI003518A4F4